MPTLHVRLTLSFLLLAGTSGHLAGQGRAAGSVDREYTLESTILGYRGVGGEIDGIRNPTIRALTGETVRITIVNGELMVHDIALEKHEVKSTEILEKGARTSLTFRADRSDTYYCTIAGHRAAGMEGRLDVTDTPRERSEGVPPERDGQTLPLDFESGTLENWTATGTAFGVVDGAVSSLPGGRSTGHAGSYWVSSGARGGALRGTLTSVPFRVTHPYASFLVSGGAFAGTRAEIVLRDGGEVLYAISGSDHGMLRPAVADLSAHLGKDIFIRLVDEESGATVAAYLKEHPWAYIAFDHFRFHAARPFFPNEVTATEVRPMPPLDHVLHAGLSAEEAAGAMKVPDGFTVTLAAAEPDVVRPIAFALDDRGRLWVAEAHTYPVRAPDGEGRDRILIFEDTTGDGRLDSRKVFIEGLNLVSGIELGFGGVWVGAAPYLMFIPIEPGTDRPAGPPQVLLDGWGYQDTHEMLNTFTWGPDGWLYGTHGVFTRSNVGKPGAADTERVRLNGAIWRFHPTTHAFEVVAEGTSNPWGLDFNDYGHAFTTVCVIEHLYHVVPGARYTRQAGKHFNPHTFDDIRTIADHLHWAGDQGPHAGNRRSDAAGGGHAHAGAMIYLGGDGWPGQSRNTIFMNNIHGYRTNTDILQRKGSGYVGAHGADFLFTNDSWSQMLNFRYGPDGSVHVTDWYDKNQCHSSNPKIHDKTLGRIFKITHASDRRVQVDLSKLPSEELAALQLHRNDWYVRHARRILQERGRDPKVHAILKRTLREHPDTTRKLRALWALHVTGGLNPRDAVDLLDHPDEYLRAWAVSLLVEDRRPSNDVLRRFARLARQDRSPMVRLYLASALQRIPAGRRWEVLEELAAHEEDAEDHNLPLMVWYAAEPLAEVDMVRALELAERGRLPRIFSFMVQRVGAIGTQDALRVLTDRLGRTTDGAQQAELLKGITAIVGRQTGKEKETTK